MKMLKSVIVLISLFCGANAASAEQYDTLRFRVSGNCEMCKETIEEALDVRGVKSAVWNIDTKIIEVVYTKSKISEDKIHQLIAEAGYETEKTPANQKSYRSLPHCCQYEPELHRKP